MQPVHTALHKGLAVPERPGELALGFCSQVGRGSSACQACWATAQCSGHSVRLLGGL